MQIFIRNNKINLFCSDNILELIRLIIIIIHVTSLLLVYLYSFDYIHTITSCNYLIMLNFVDFDFEPYYGIQDGWLYILYEYFLLGTENIIQN